MDTKRSIAAVLGVCSVALPMPLLAQAISGTVHDALSAAPLRAVLITLRNNASNQSMRLLTDSLGQFVARTAAGDYTLFADQLGYAREERRISLVATSPATVAIRMDPAPINLSAVVARGTSSCGRTQDQSIAQLWYLARTVIGSAVAGSQRSVHVRKYTRELDLRLRKTVNEHSESMLTSSWRGFETPAGDSVTSKGFVQHRPDGTYYFAPDADLLLSDAFVGAHCFRISAKRANDGMVGLEFSPRKDGKVAGLSGTLWLEARTGFLSNLEFTYQGLEVEVDAEYAGGRVDFARQPDGSWIIPRWLIRMPRFEITTLSAGNAMHRALPQVSSVPRKQVSVSGIIESGGEVLGVLSPASANAGVNGIVFDSIRGQPLASALVMVRGTSVTASTDAYGKFEFRALPPGDYRVSFDHESFKTLPAFDREVTITVIAGRADNVPLTVPTVAAIVNRHCNAASLRQAALLLGRSTEQLGLLTGTVRRSGGTAVAETSVSAQWRIYAERAGALNENTMEFNSETDASGRFTLCGLPTDEDLRIFVQDKKDPIARERLPANLRVRHRELVIPD